MFLTVQEAVALAQTAKIEFIKDWNTISDVNTDGTIDLYIDVKFIFDHPQAQNLIYTLDLRSANMHSITFDDLRLSSDDLLSSFIISATDEDQFDREKWTLGYSNQYDQPETMKDWLASPERFMMAHTNLVSALKGFTSEYFVRKHKFHPMNTPLENYSLRAHLNKLEAQA